MKELHCIINLSFKDMIVQIQRIEWYKIITENSLNKVLVLKNKFIALISRKEICIYIKVEYIKQNPYSKISWTYLGATKLYFTHCMCVVIILFNTGLYSLQFLPFLLQNYSFCVFFCSRSILHFEF